MIFIIPHDVVYSHIYYMFVLKTCPQMFPASPKVSVWLVGDWEWSCMWDRSLNIYCKCPAPSLIRFVFKRSSRERLIGSAAELQRCLVLDWSLPSLKAWSIMDYQWNLSECLWLVIGSCCFGSRGNPEGKTLPRPNRFCLKLLVVFRAEVSWVSD